MNKSIDWESAMVISLNDDPPEYLLVIILKDIPDYIMCLILLFENENNKE